MLLVGLLFVLLSADVALDDVRALGTGGLIVVAGLILVVRPFSVWTATLGLALSRGERVFISAMAPRGIVAAAVASLTAVTLESQGVEGGQALKALVFLVIAATVIVSGVAARPLAAIRGVRLPRRDRVAILGVRGLALALADQLRAAGHSGGLSRIGPEAIARCRGGRVSGRLRRPPRRADDDAGPT